MLTEDESRAISKILADLADDLITIQAKERIWEKVISRLEPPSETGPSLSPDD